MKQVAITTWQAQHMHVSHVLPKSTISSGTSLYCCEKVDYNCIREQKIASLSTQYPLFLQDIKDGSKSRIDSTLHYPFHL